MLKRWIAKLLGIKPGLTVTIPPGAVLIMPVGATVDTMNVVGGNVYWTSDIEDTAKTVKLAVEGTIHWDVCHV